MQNLFTVHMIFARYVQDGTIIKASFHNRYSIEKGLPK